MSSIKPVAASFVNDTTANTISKDMLHVNQAHAKGDGTSAVAALNDIQGSLVSSYNLSPSQTQKINEAASNLAIDVGSDAADQSGKYAKDLKALADALNDAGIQFDDKGAGHYDASSAKGSTDSAKVNLDSTTDVGTNIGLSQINDDIKKYSDAHDLDPNSTKTSNLLSFLKRDVQVDSNLTVAGRNALLADIAQLENPQSTTNVSGTIHELAKSAGFALGDHTPSEKDVTDALSTVTAGTDGSGADIAEKPQYYRALNTLQKSISTNTNLSDAAKDKANTLINALARNGNLNGADKAQAQAQLKSLLSGDPVASSVVQASTDLQNTSSAVAAKTDGPLSVMVPQIYAMAKSIDLFAPAGGENSITSFMNNVSQFLKNPSLDDTAKQKLQLFVQGLTAAMPENMQLGSTPSPQAAEAFGKELAAGLSSLLTKVKS